MPKYKTKPKSRVSKPNKSILWPKLYNNKWLMFVGIVFIAGIGVIAIRVSLAAGQFAQNCPLIISSGRRPEDSEPHIDYEACGNGTVYLRKSTNGEVQTASVTDAQTKGEQMYNEMIAAQTQSAPATPPAPATTPATNTDPKSTANQPTQPTTSTNVPTSANSLNTPNTANQSNPTASKPDFVFTLRKTIDIKPKLPQNSSGVVSVKFLLDGKLIATQTQAPFTLSFNTTKYTNGSHTLTTTAINKDGSTANNYNYNIKIENSNSILSKILEWLGF